MLLDPFEKQFDLPTLPVEFRDRKGIKHCVIGDEPIKFVGGKVFIGHHPEWFRIALSRPVLSKPDHLITDHSRFYISWFRVNCLILHVVLSHSDEESFLPIDPVEQAKEVHVAFVDHINGSRLYKKLIKDVDIVYRSLRQQHENWEIASQIQQGMHLNTPFVFSERCPWTQFQTQADCAAVKGVDQIVDIEPEIVVILIQWTSNVHEHTREVSIDPPVAKFVGFGKCIPGNSMSDPTMIEFTGHCFQAVLDIPEAVSLGKLGKTHHIEMVPAGEVADAMVPVVSGNAFIKFIFRDYGHQLCENCLSTIHGDNLYDFAKNADFKSLKNLTLITYLLLANYMASRNFKRDTSDITKVS